MGVNPTLNAGQTLQERDAKSYLYLGHVFKQTLDRMDVEVRA